MEKILEQILIELNGLKNGQSRLESNLVQLGSNQERLESNQERFGINQERLESNLVQLGSNQERLESKIDSFRSSIVKDLTPYIENVEKLIDDSKNEIHSRFDRLERQVRMIDADLDELNIQVQKNKRDIEKIKQN